MGLSKFGFKRPSGGLGGRSGAGAVGSGSGASVGRRRAVTSVLLLGLFLVGWVIAYSGETQSARVLKENTSQFQIDKGLDKLVEVKAVGTDGSFLAKSGSKYPAKSYTNVVLLEGSVKGVWWHKSERVLLTPIDAKSLVMSSIGFLSFSGIWLLYLLKQVFAWRYWGGGFYGLWQGVFGTEAPQTWKKVMWWGTLALSLVSIGGWALVLI